jgi:stage II sporulation protein D
VAAKGLRVAAADGQALTLAWGRVQRAYPGCVEMAAAGGRLQVIDEVPLEDYVRGVMSAETPSTFHPEALKAMAVAVRTYALSSRGRHGADADLCDGTHCQVYHGVRRVPASIAAAVAGTVGLVALYDGRPIEAVYSADCGGFTESCENAWGRAKPVPYLRPVLDSARPGDPPYCAVNPGHTWRIRLSQAELRRFAGADGRVTARVLATSESGHVQKVALVRAPTGTEATSPGDCASEDQPAPTACKTYTGVQWRRIIGSTRVRSMHFTIESAPDGSAEMVGTGWGHGVGLCQYGAEGMARSAAAPTFDAILRHYYAGITVGPLPDNTQSAAAAGSR